MHRTLELVYVRGIKYYIHVIYIRLEIFELFCLIVHMEQRNELMTFVNVITFTLDLFITFWDTYFTLHVVEFT